MERSGSTLRREAGKTMKVVPDTGWLFLDGPFGEKLHFARFRFVRQSRRF
jgi:hypothetical protein